MNGDHPKVYVVDDDRDLGASVARLLNRHGFAADPFLEPTLLLAAYPDAPASCIVTDVMMDDLDGFQFADRLRLIDPAVAIIFMTAWPTTANAVDSVRRHGGLDYLEKPIDEARLLGAVQEGVLRRSFLKNGQFLDQMLWSILAEEWRQTKAVWGHRRVH